MRLVVRSVLAVVRVRVGLRRAVLQPCVSRVGRVVLGVLVVPPPSPTSCVLRVLRVARVGRLTVRGGRVVCWVSQPRVVSCSACVTRVPCRVSCCGILVIFADIKIRGEPSYHPFPQ